MLPTTSAPRPRTPQTVFDRVAPYYDAVNSVLSLGMDRRWRRRAVRELGLRPGDRVVDVATGTGGLAVEMARAGAAAVTGCDLNERMLSVARRRAARSAQIDFVQCDATELPFPAGAFDAAAIGFAIDDMPDRAACIGEVRRVLRPGGRIALLELSQPETPTIRAAYRVYLRTFRAIGRGSLDGYRHLEHEILGYRGARAIEGLLTAAGFVGYRRAVLTLGAACLHLARTPTARTEGERS